MTFTVVPEILEGRHVRLEPLAEHHIDGLWMAGQMAEDWAYLPRSCFTSRDDVADWVQQAFDFREKGIHYSYVLVHPDIGEVMGSTRYLNVRLRDHGLEIGYTWVARPWQRTAVNTEAKFLLLQHAFESLGAYRVELKTDARNLRSQKAIERIGGVREGVFRRHMVTQGGFVRDSVYYSITDQDWPAVSERLRGMLDRPPEGRA